MNFRFFCINLLLIIVFLSTSFVASAKTYDFNVGHINGFFDEYRIINALALAQKGDIVKLHINSIGGDLDKTYRIINAMKHTKATTHMYVKNAYSAAALIALSGDVIHYNNNTNFMFHLARTTNCLTYFLIGELCVIPKDEPDQKEYLHYLNKIAKPHLTKHQYNKVLDEQDVYVKGYELFKKVSK